MKTDANGIRPKNASIWGSGLLAVDIVIRYGDEVAFEITAGGTCGNVLANLAHLGWRASAKGRLGADAAGRILTDHLNDSGVDSSGLTFDECVETPIIVERFGIGDPVAPRHRFEWICPQCSSPVPRFRPTPIPMLDIGLQADKLPDIFFFDRPTPGNLKLATQLKARGAVIIFEPPRLKEERSFENAVRLADILKLAVWPNGVDLSKWLAESSLVIVTNASEGLRFKASRFNGITTDWVDLPAFHISRAVDSCGSGDWVTTGLVHAFYAVSDLAGDAYARLHAALKYGQALAALNCMLPGARGLSRVFSHAEIADMVAVVIGKGLSSLETTVSSRSTQFGRLRALEAVCGECSRVASR